MLQAIHGNSWRSRITSLALRTHNGTSTIVQRTVDTRQSMEIHSAKCTIFWRNLTLKHWHRLTFSSENHWHSYRNRRCYTSTTTTDWTNCTSLMESSKNGGNGFSHSTFQYQYLLLSKRSEYISTIFARFHWAGGRFWSWTSTIWPISGFSFRKYSYSFDQYTHSFKTCVYFQQQLRGFSKNSSCCTSIIPTDWISANKWHVFLRSSNMVAMYS